MPTNSPRLGLMAAAALSLLLGACAMQNQPVSDFGRAATKLAASYAPILNRPASLCEESRTLALILTEPSFDVRALGADEAIRLCRQLQAEQRVRAVVASSIGAYGQQLAVLAGADPRALDADIAAIGEQAKAVADQGGTPTFDGARVDALTRLVTLLADMVRGRQAQRLTRQLIADAQGPLDSLVTEMGLWTEGMVLPRLQTAIARREDALRLALVPASDRSAVPGAQALPGITYTTRLAQFTLLKEIEALKAEQAAAQGFSQAATALLVAHRGLGDAIGHVSTQAQLSALKAFIDQVRGLRDAAVL